MIFWGRLPSVIRAPLLALLSVKKIHFYEVCKFPLVCLKCVAMLFILFCFDDKLHEGEPSFVTSVLINSNQPIKKSST